MGFFRRKTYDIVAARHPVFDGRRLWRAGSRLPRRRRARSAPFSRAEGSAVPVETVLADPGGNSDRYMALAGAMMREGCRHIVGTVTSQARKDIIPIVEKHDGQLWYVCPYEGFEANENVVYTGACPNQHLVPLFETLLPRFGDRVYLAGANYVWGWEMNRLARELVHEADGEIVGERCLPIDETNVDRLMAEVEARRPDFVLSNLIGPSSYAFLRAMRRLADRDGDFAPELCPVVSCDLTECELVRDRYRRRGRAARRRILFHSRRDTPQQAASAKGSRTPSANRGRCRASSPRAMRRSEPALRRSRCAAATSPRLVRAALHRHRSDSVLGPLTSTLRPITPHCRSISAGSWETGSRFCASTGAIAADPYLQGRGPRRRRRGSATSAEDRVMSATPSFIGQTAIIVHRPGETTERLARGNWRCSDCESRPNGRHSM